MPAKPVATIVAEALIYFMGDRWNQSSLGAAAGVAPNTVGNAINPERRAPGKSGKQPSVKVAELAQMAEALGVDLADLVTDATPEERGQVLRRKAAAYYEKHGELPPWAPPRSKGDKHRDADAA